MAEIIAQTIGIVAMAMNCLSFQQKERKTVIAFQLVGTTLFSINFFMLGAIAGAILNLLGAIRSIVFIYKEKLRADHPAWLCGFIATYVLSYVAVFTVFGKEPTVGNLIIEILPVIGMVLTTVSFRYNDAKTIRRFGFINAPLWLVYNIYSKSIGAVICESFNILSIIIGTLRHDVKRKKK